jgi:hypothetical protein
MRPVALHALDLDHTKTDAVDYRWDSPSAERRITNACPYLENLWRRSAVHAG